MATKGKGGARGGARRKPGSSAPAPTPEVNLSSPPAAAPFAAAAHPWPSAPPSATTAHPWTAAPPSAAPTNPWPAPVPATPPSLPRPAPPPSAPGHAAPLPAWCPESSAAPYHGSQPSSLNPWGRHGAEGERETQRGKKMPKRRRSGDLVAGGPAKTLAQRNLYLLFNDWCWGYSIRKLDLRPLLAADVKAEEVTDAATIDHTVRSLPPAVFCLEASRDFPAHLTAAFDTKIVTINPRIPDWHPCSLKSGRGRIHPVAPVKFTAYDVQSRAIMLGPLPKAEPWKPIHIAVGHDRLFALSRTSFERLSVKPRECWVRPWKKLQDAPFESEDVFSHAVHPDGKTLFLSVLGDDSFFTFTFDTANVGLGWEARRGWSLPFHGRAHYDPDLNVWVGMSGPPHHFGYVCTCPVASTNSEDDDEEQCLPRRCCKEFLCGTEPGERLISCSLLYMGAGSHFCLALAIRSKNNEHPPIPALRFDEGDSAWSGANNPSPYRHVLRLTTFSLKYDENGDLTTGNSLRIQHYNVPQGATEAALERPFAFVM